MFLRLLTLFLLLPETERIWAEEKDDLTYGLYLDISYADDLGGATKNLPWRSKLTTNVLNAFDPNMGMGYLIKTATPKSPWGFEFGLHDGNDMVGQPPTPGQPPVPGEKALLYVSRLNASYLAPIGKGLKFTAGLMNSFIGYESMYAAYNPNYTRAWLADYSPYFLIGAGAEYQARDNLKLSFYLLTDYYYLAVIGHQPKYGSQAKWGFAPDWTLTQNIFVGAEQSDSNFAYWRGFSDSILEWKKDDWLVAMAYDIGTEKRPSSGLQTLWMGSAIWARWHISGPWSIAARPEIYWDPDGELTGYQQFIGAMTLTAEYRVNIGPTQTLLRTEFRHDTSTGPQGGFYNASSATTQLVPNQNLLFFALIWSFDNPHE